MDKRSHSHRNSFWKRHSLTVVVVCILIFLFLLYRANNPGTHAGAFYGNAIADWAGTLVIVLATKRLQERGSPESRHFRDTARSRIGRFCQEHSLTLFLMALFFTVLCIYGRMDPGSRWGQVVGNILSELTQVLGIVLLTKKLVETGSKESRR
jgi:hypothetical protein